MCAISMNTFNQSIVDLRDSFGLLNYSLYLISFQRLFYNLHDAIYLLDANYRETANVVGIWFALRNATCKNEFWWLEPPGFVQS